MAAAERVSGPATGTLPTGHADGAAVRPRTGTEPPAAFPGCTPVHLPPAELESFDQRLEYWEAVTETAWICEPVSPYHERPSRLLPQLAVLIAKVSGSRIECYGSMDLLLRDHRGRPQSIMQADESLYLHPDRARLPAAAMVVGQDDFPDVVLEVDHTTDARRGKLPLYESWGFPEVWVDVPDAPSPSRPRSRRPGLTIHLLEGGRYRVAAESRAFPGWTAAEIHTALNEPVPSAQTSAVLDGWVRRWARGKAPDRTTTRCCARSVGRGSSAAVRKPARRWSARCCGRGASRFRRISPPARRCWRRPPRPCSLRRRSPARTRRTSLTRSPAPIGDGKSQGPRLHREWARIWATWGG